MGFRIQAGLGWRGQGVPGRSWRPEGGHAWHSGPLLGLMPSLSQMLLQGAVSGAGLIVCPHPHPRGAVQLCHPGISGTSSRPAQQPFWGHFQFWRQPMILLKQHDPAAPPAAVTEWLLTGFANRTSGFGSKQISSSFPQNPMLQLWQNTHSFSHTVESLLKSSYLSLECFRPWDLVSSHF